MSKTKKPAAKKAAKAVPPTRRSKGKPIAPPASAEPVEVKEQAEAPALEGATRSEPAAKKSAKGKAVKDRDPRLPKPGTVLRKEWRGKEYEITVLDEGFEYAGKTYRSLSKIANEITGTTWNGFLWMGLAQRPKPEGKAPPTPGTESQAKPEGEVQP